MEVFWTQWWFYVIAVLLIVLAYMIFYALKVKAEIAQFKNQEKIKTEETERLRKVVARDFHDQVGNQLASISVLVQLIKSKADSKSDELHELLSKLDHFTRSLFTGTKDFIWAIDPNNDELKELVLYIKDFGEELFEYSGISFHMKTEGDDWKEKKLPTGWARHLVMICKEALTNSLKHSNCENVFINFTSDANNYQIAVEDDGIGINGHVNEAGRGLFNMKSRIKKINAELNIEKRTESGTRVLIKGELPQTGGVNTAGH